MEEARQHGAFITSGLNDKSMWRLLCLSTMRAVPKPKTPVAGVARIPVDVAVLAALVNPEVPCMPQSVAKGAAKAWLERR
jgi:membrane protein YqaA with SNARE-associated domain